MRQDSPEIDEISAEKLKHDSILCGLFSMENLELWSVYKKVIIVKLIR